jgi:hypothetical protein
LVGSSTHDCPHSLIFSTPLVPPPSEKVKQFRYRPGVAQRVPGGYAPRFPWHSAHEVGEVSLTHRPPSPPGMFLLLIFIRGWVDRRAMVRSEGICHWKIQWRHRE